MLNSLKQLWQILSPLDKRKVIYVLILVMGMALIESAGVISIMPFLAVLSNPEVVESNHSLKLIYDFTGAISKQNFIVYLGFLSLGIVIFSTIFKIITQYAVNRFASLQRHYFATRLLKIYLQQNYEFFIQRNSATLVKNILSEVDQLIWTMILPALTLMSYGVVLLSMVGILLLYDPLMAIATAAVLGIFYCVIYMLVRKKLTEIGQEFTQANKERYQTCQEALAGIKDVMINNAKHGYIEQFEQSSRVFARHIATRDTLGQVPLNIIETVGYGCLIGLAMILVVSGKEVSHILPVLGLYGFAAYRMLPAAQNMYRSISQIKFSEQVLSILKPEFALENTEHIDSLKSDIQKLKFENSIRLENIFFAYPNRLEQPILNDFSLEIKKNSSLGVIGKSGSGKSTLMDIMLGLLTPQRGEIYIDDVALTQHNINTWRDLVGYVPQFIYLADKSIAENIAFGIPSTQIDFKQVERVAKLAQIDDFIQHQLPLGYHTIVGERGVMLSGGQRQRIGIARALYKNPQVLFMDEATSALDTETECAVNKVIHELKYMLTVITISHNESLIKNYDAMLNIRAGFNS
ncbi:ABC transporter ATP-binding protein [Acinetobacter kyonggiensis]|uniref:ABC-type bacteriocin/lantibiotic exporter, contains an N-terminal double-glycine peptidase domain n=1 Tax=Acinetobacter kyonggiensis TaxID=595670 RepID=A0A1H3J6Y5_9GAMM|nr:ABC transporter ATP-binding protein [Acinetobacter kyonggiensis]SDY35557.1 ABC-type bacteriocin/lantibiotic exporter, contains an N-terminal double-glycine peptidase domain [Acinetobacter kyonggiensis]